MGGDRDTVGLLDAVETRTEPGEPQRPGPGCIHVHPPAGNRLQCINDPAAGRARGQHDRGFFDITQLRPVQTTVHIHSDGSKRHAEDMGGFGDGDVRIG